MVRILLFLFAYTFVHADYRQSEISLGVPNVPWFMEQATQIQERLGITESDTIGKILTSGRRPSELAPTPAIVPGTVLTSILANGLVNNITDPYYEQNLKSFPDMNKAGRAYYTYWFTANFTASPDSGTGRTYLHLRGINYIATVYFNQAILTTIDNHAVEGQFLRHLFDITPLMSKTGAANLAILVEPVTYPGDPNGGQGGDHVIARNAATSQYVDGWDWVQPTPDRNTGIWDKISLFKTNDYILLQNPRIRTNGTVNTTLQVEVTVYNAGPDPISGKVSYTIANTSVAQSQTFSVGGKQTVLVVFPITNWANPKIWWPNLYGDQNLYNMTLVATTSVISDQLSVVFGVRDLAWEVIGGYGNGYRFYVNGKSVFIRGGNWIVTDQLLRYTTDATMYDHHVRMHKEMGFNTIRVWGGGIAERPEFYEACDKYGLLVVQDFWMSGDCNGRWGGSYDYPDDYNLYLRNVQDTVLMLRNHPSLLIYTGGNELDPANKNPPPAISQQMYIWLNFTYPPNPQSIDGSRPFIMSTMSQDNGTSYALAPADGPYGLLQPRDWFAARTPGLSVNLTFNPEAGSCSVPVLESLQKFFSPATLSDFPYKTSAGCTGNEELTGPVTRVRGNKNEAKVGAFNAVWDYHLFEGYCDSHSINQLWRFGQPLSIDDFAMEAQLVGYEQYRALLEGYTSHMWTLFNGIIIWKTQGPWTELRGHFYDFYLEQTGSFYGSKKATEHLHVQLNQGTSWSIGVVNHNYTALGPFVVSANFYDLSGKSINTVNFNVSSVPANSIFNVGALSWPDPTPVTANVFLRLRLATTTGTVQSENFYWLSYPGATPSQNEFVSLYTLRQSPVVVTGSLQSTTADGKFITTVTVSSEKLAFFIRLALVVGRQVTGENRILPSWYSDNYFTLLPGESKNVIIECDQRDAQNQKPWVQVSGWNVVPATLQ